MVVQAQVETGQAEGRGHRPGREPASVERGQDGEGQGVAHHPPGVRGQVPQRRGRRARSRRARRRGSPGGPGLGLTAASTRARTRRLSWIVPRKTAILSRRFASMAEKGASSTLADERGHPEGEGPDHDLRARVTSPHASSAQATPFRTSRKRIVEERALTPWPPSGGRRGRAAPGPPRGCRPRRGRRRARRGPRGTPRGRGVAPCTSATGVGGRSTGGKLRESMATTSGRAIVACRPSIVRESWSRSTSVVPSRRAAVAPAGTSSRWRSTRSSRGVVPVWRRDHQLVQRGREVHLALAGGHQDRLVRSPPPGRSDHPGGGRSTAARPPRAPGARAWTCVRARPAPAGRGRETG